MKPVAKLIPSLLIAAVALSCNFDKTAPDPALSLKKGHDAGNPACQLSGHAKSNKKGPVDFLCAIEIPGNALTSSQKGWAEQSNGMYFLTDASNSGVDVIDIGTHTYVGRVGGMAGNVGVGGGTAASNGAGPNAFVSAPRRGGHGHDDGHGHGDNRVLFVSDGNSTVHVVDMDALQIIASVSTAKAECDGGTTTSHYCGRSNEIAYDPVHHIVAVSNPNPLAVAAPHDALEGYLTFISARAPYRVLGHVSFGPGTVEGHIWAPPLNRFLLPMQNAPGGPFIAVINAKTRQVDDRRFYNCAAIPGAVPGSLGNNNLQMGPGDNLWAQMCGRPMRMDVRTGAVRSVVANISTGDQDWFNPGDGNFYWTGTPTGGVASLGVADARSGALLQTLPNIAGASPSAYAKTNEIFTRTLFAAATDATNRCVVKGRGCVVVWAHTGDK